MSKTIKYYPEIITEKKDRYLSRLILVEYAGCESELSSISRYIYQSVILNKVNVKVSETLEEIAIDEIEHFKMLGMIISKLGEKPSLILSNINNKRVENIKKISVKNIISENILKEYMSIENYKRIINIIDNESIEKYFKQIISEEKQHIKKLEVLYNSL